VETSAGGPKKEKKKKTKVKQRGAKKALTLFTQTEGLHAFPAIRIWGRVQARKRAINCAGSVSQGAIVVLKGDEKEREDAGLVVEQKSGPASSREGVLFKD